MESMGQNNSCACYVPRMPGRVLEGMKSFIGGAVILWVPTLLYCKVIGAMPFYPMVILQVLGIALGVLIYKKSTPNFDARLLFQ